MSSSAGENRDHIIRYECLLCSMPKQSWEVFYKFNQIVCRACINYEGSRLASTVQNVLRMKREAADQLQSVIFESRYRNTLLPPPPYVPPPQPTYVPPPPMANVSQTYIPVPIPRCSVHPYPTPRRGRRSRAPRFTVVSSHENPIITTCNIQPTTLLTRLLSNTPIDLSVDEPNIETNTVDNVEHLTVDINPEEILPTSSPDNSI